MRLAIIILCLIRTLGVDAQSPKFSFTKEFVKITTQDIGGQIQVFKGSYLSENQIQDKKAVLGTVTCNTNFLIFTPLIPFQTNTPYTAVFKDIFFEFSIRLAPNYKHLKVEEIYPNTTKLPANFLKWYIAFSKPINSTNIYNYISLVHTKTNTKVDRALLPLETPLLSDDGKLLTLWIEPGRQKRDLGPNIRMGEVLKKGESYILIIDKNLKDIDGIPMNVDFKHTFSVESSDRVRPDISKWRFMLPKANTKQPLIIDLNDVLDFGSLHDNLVVIDKNGQVVDGDFIIETNKSRVVFYVVKNWLKGGYVIRCKRVIEDISGNNLERLFDRAIQKEIVNPILERTFSITD